MPRPPDVLRSLVVAALVAPAGGSIGVELASAVPAFAGAVAAPARGSQVSEWGDRSAHPGPAPAAGEDCAIVYYPPRHSLVLYGGKGDDNRDLNELWECDLDGNAWHKIEPVGTSPPPREDHTIIYDPVGDRLVLYGGEDGPTTNALWTFDFATRAWHELIDPMTPAREDHTAIYDPRGKRMVIFGGWANENVNYYDVRALGLDPQSRSYQKWVNLTSEASHPYGRCDHAAVYDSVRNRMVIFGGWDKDQKQYLGDTWAYTFSADPESAGTWKQIKARHSHPPKRRHAVGVYDAQRNWFVICGGFGDEGFLNDVWALDLTQDIWINVTPGPQPRLDHQAIFDPRSGRMILYGGDAHLERKFRDLWELRILPDAPVEDMLMDAANKPRIAKAAGDSTRSR